MNVPKKALLSVAGVLAVTLVAIQFVPAHRSNRLGTGDPNAPREVMYVLRRACYDCHSTETRWPIWAYVAPVSWQVIKDVEKARGIMNFSNWASYDTTTQRALRHTIEFSTRSHRMPTWYYLTLHPDAKLSEQDYATLAAWAKAP